MYHAIADYARHHSVLWMFGTVVLGAVLIPTGILPLQLTGTALIAIGMVTPIALTAQQRRRVATKPARQNENEREHRRGVLLRDVERRRKWLLNQYGLEPLLQEDVIDAILYSFNAVLQNQHPDQASPMDSDIAAQFRRLWQDTLTTPDLNRVAVALRVDLETMLSSQRALLRIAEEDADVAFLLRRHRAAAQAQQPGGLSHPPTPSSRTEVPQSRRVAHR